MSGHKNNRKKYRPLILYLFLLGTAGSLTLTLRPTAHLLFSNKTVILWADM